MKPALLAATSLLALACLWSPLSQRTSGPEPATPASNADDASSSVSIIQNEYFTIVQLHPANSKLGSLLPIYAQAAIAQGRKPFVEWDAEWWPSCRTVFTGLVDEVPQMMTSFEGVYLIRLDVDEWDWGNRPLGFEVNAVPVFFRLDEQGRPTGDVIDGGAWGEDSYKNIARVMGEWFHQP